MAVLVVLLAIVATIAWACAESGDAGKPAGAQAPAPAASGAPTVTATATVTVTATPSPEESADARVRQEACHDLELTVQPEKSSYGRGAEVRFVVTVTNEGEKACVRNVGPKALTLTVTSGADRVWSSADCQQGAGEVRELAPGKPYESEVEWDRTRSNAALCGTRQAAVKPGWYVVVAQLDQLRSEEAVFQLR